MTLRVETELHPFRRRFQKWGMIIVLILLILLIMRLL